MNRSICLTAVLMVAVSAVTFHDLVSEEWRLYKLQHKKNYKSDTEDKFRMKIYMENRRKVAEHNVKYERGLVSFKLELNKLADMLPREFSSTYNGYRRDTPPKNGVKPEGASYIAATNVELPEEVDWRNQGAVTPVKDQGNCGSCWAFSATGSLEGQFYRKTGKLVSLSEQNLIDCSSKNGNGGCEGGMMDYAFEYIKENGGIDTEDSYPYEAEDDNCRFNESSVGASDNGFVDIPRGDEGSLQNAVATKGPVSVAIDASHDSFQLYEGGVYYEPDCSTKSLDHGVLVVGYGTTEKGEDYWLVKNSWGANWGDHGYIKMARNRNNNCGIASAASFPLV